MSAGGSKLEGPCSVLCHQERGREEGSFGPTSPGLNPFLGLPMHNFTWPEPKWDAGGHHHHLHATARSRMGLKLGTMHATHIWRRFSKCHLHSLSGIRVVAWGCLRFPLVETFPRWRGAIESGLSSQLIAPNILTSAVTAPFTKCTAMKQRMRSWWKNKSAAAEPELRPVASSMLPRRASRKVTRRASRRVSQRATL